MTDAEREALIEAGTHEYALQAIAQRLSRHLGRPVETADVVEAVDELIDEVRNERQRRRGTMTTETQYGWKCPVCGRGNAPWKGACDCLPWQQHIVNQPECPRCHLTCFMFGCAVPDCPRKPKVTCEVTT